MKIMLFSGTHSRHIYIHENIMKNFNVCGTVVMQREPTNLKDNIKGYKNNNLNNWSIIDRQLYLKHFEQREIIEKRYYKEKNINLYDEYCDVLKVEQNELNSKKVEKFIKDKNPDLCFIFGTNIIKENIVNIMPKYKINLHLGLSPWYRGSATLFWPFYHLQPQFCGSTFHQITQEPDAGDIIHQCVPKLEYGDTLHEVGAKVVVISAKESLFLLKMISEEKQIKFHKQRNSGKNWLIKDFEPHHLTSIYNYIDMIEYNIVDRWLNNELGNRKPKIIRAF